MSPKTISMEGDLHPFRKGRRVPAVRKTEKRRYQCETQGLGSSSLLGILTEQRIPRTLAEASGNLGDCHKGELSQRMIDLGTLQD